MDSLLVVYQDFIRPNHSQQSNQCEDFGYSTIADVVELTTYTKYTGTNGDVKDDPTASWCIRYFVLCRKKSSVLSSAFLWTVFSLWTQWFWKNQHFLRTKEKECCNFLVCNILYVFFFKHYVVIHAWWTQVGAPMPLHSHSIPVLWLESDILHYILVTMDVSTKWSEAYTWPANHYLKLLTRELFRLEEERSCTVRRSTTSYLSWWETCAIIWELQKLGLLLFSSSVQWLFKL